MAKTAFKLEGGPELKAALDELSKAVSRKVQNEALEAGGFWIERTASNLAPRGDKEKEHMADHIVVAPVSARNLRKRGRVGEVVMEVGPEKKPNDFFYAYFLEHGTKFMAARPFMRPAFDQEASRAMQTIKERLWDAIRKRLPHYRLK